MFVADANMMLGGHSSSTVKRLPWKVVLISERALQALQVLQDDDLEESSNTPLTI